MGKAYICKTENPSESNAVAGFSVNSVKQVLKARVISAPVETGAKSFDNKVLDPYELIVSGEVVIDDDGKYKKTLDTLRQMYANRSFSFYSASDGVNFYENLIMTECPIEREAQKYDLLQIEIKFVNAMLVQAKSAKSANGENSNTRNYGYVAGKVSA